MVVLVSNPRVVFVASTASTGPTGEVIVNILQERVSISASLNQESPCLQAQLIYHLRQVLYRR